MKIRAVTFDFWNTLFRDFKSVDYQAQRLKYFLEIVSNYHDCCEEQVDAAFSYSAAVCHRIWLQEYRTPDARERLEIVLAQLALTLPEQILDQLARYSRELLYEFPPSLIEGAAETLAALAPRYKLAVISDTGFAPGEVLREVMRRNNILDHFTVLTFSDEVGRSKPHESVFLHTAQGLNVQPQEMLHIGDLELTDVAGAKGVGAYAVLFAEDFNNQPQSAADYTVSKYSELRKLLSKVFNDEL